MMLVIIKASNRDPPANSTLIPIGRPNVDAHQQNVTLTLIGIGKRNDDADQQTQRWRSSANAMMTLIGERNDDAGQQRAVRMMGVGDAG
jgi:hypothetical protein